MKKFNVTVQYSHESFGGYTHRDGSEIFLVEARNHDSARKKALKIARSKTNYECSANCIEELNWNEN